MSAVIKAFKAINGLNNLDYILDRRNNGAQKVALKRFIFFDNSRNAFRAVAGREIEEVDREKLQGEITLAKLRRFEQVWRKYGKACVQNKNDDKVKKISDQLYALMKEIGDLDNIKSIARLNEKDYTAYQTLDAAINLLSIDSKEKDFINQKKVVFNENASFLRNQIKSLEKDLEGIEKKFNDNDLRNSDITDFEVKLIELETNIKQYDNYLKKNLGLHTKSVIAKHHDFIEQKNAILKRERNVLENFKKLQEAFTKYNLAERALSTVTNELQSKIKERNKWDPPEKYAKLSLEELKQHAHRIEQMLKEAEGMDVERFQNKDYIRRDVSNLRSDLLTIKEYISDAHILQRKELDKQIQVLQAKRSEIFKERDTLQNNYLRLKTPLIKR